MNSYSVDIYSKNQLPNVETELQKIADETKINNSRKLQILLVLEEILINILTYNTLSENEPVSVYFYNNGNYIKVVIIDSGIPFNPIDYKSKTTPANIDNAEPGGLGIHLAKSFSNGIDYKYENNNNILTLVFNLRE
jgi:anti-sigma regulatory factor (Ser/Thr protein kinase)